MKTRKGILLIAGMVTWGIVSAVTVKEDPLLRMPGTQPGDGVALEASNRCLNCHAGYNTAVEPGHNWKGSMMAQAARDPMWYACLTVALQDSLAVLGNTNAGDLCIRCHSPAAWLGGRSEPTNLGAMTGSDFDGLSCDSCHTMYDPFHMATYSGAREGADWTGYWDEATSLSQGMAATTLSADQVEAAKLRSFAGAPWAPGANYTENGSGQYYASAGSQKRASFADAEARHQMLYSRFHKSKYFCSACHDVSNPVLANLGLSGLPDNSGGSLLTSEQYSAFKYFHVERTFSEFMLSAYGRQGGAATNSDFQAQGAPDVKWAAKCQDCHMRDVRGVAANKAGLPVRPDGSTEHPKSGLPLHDMTGGNVWIARILASTDPNGPVYDPVNAQLLGQGAAVLTLDMLAGESPAVNGAALFDGSNRAWQQLQLAATIKELAYNPSTGALSFKVQNNTGHKLISGFPEGRRMFINIRAYAASGAVVYEANPYDMAVGTLKGLPHAHSSPPLGANEAYVDELVYEIHPKSDITGEKETFHFVLATGRYKDNRIPPRGFDIAKAAERLSVPVWHGVEDAAYFTSAEYTGGYDAVALAIPAGAAGVEVKLYYQGTSREYIEFLRDEINGNQNLTLDPAAYVAQTDPYFAKLKAWGNTIWQLWDHNHKQGVPGLVPALMASATVGTVGGGGGCQAPAPVLVAATPGHSSVTVAWSDEHSANPKVIGYALYYDQSGKSQFIAEVGKVTSYADSGLSDGFEYCYKVTTLVDADGNGTIDCESVPSSILCATPLPNATASLTVDALQSGKLVLSGKGKTTTFQAATAFVQGDSIVIRAHVKDVTTGLPLAGATVSITFTGPQTATVTSGLSAADGWAEATWKTSKPNRTGAGGTAKGSYTVKASAASLGGYTWDGQSPAITITIQ